VRWQTSQASSRYTTPRCDRPLPARRDSPRRSGSGPARPLFAGRLKAETCGNPRSEGVSLSNVQPSLVRLATWAMHFLRVFSSRGKGPAPCRRAIWVVASSWIVRWPWPARGLPSGERGRRDGSTDEWYHPGRSGGAQRPRRISCRWVREDARGGLTDQTLPRAIRRARANGLITTHGQDWSRLPLGLLGHSGKRSCLYRGIKMLGWSDKYFCNKE